MVEATTRAEKFTLTMEDRMEDSTRERVTLAAVSRQLRSLQVQVAASGLRPDTLVSLLVGLERARGMVTRLTARDVYGVELENDEV